MMVAEIDRFVAAHIGVVDGAQRNDAQRCRQSGCRDYDIRVIWPHEGEPGQVGIVGINAGEPIDAAVVVWTETERIRSEEHTSEIKSLMRISYADFCLKKN